MDPELQKRIEEGLAKGWSEVDVAGAMGCSVYLVQKVKKKQEMGPMQAPILWEGEDKRDVTGQLMGDPAPTKGAVSTKGTDPTP